MVYSKLDNKASIALSKAKDAEHKAERVENTVNGMQRELVKIRTVLEERLPKKS
jgi:hypothetical protein